MVDAAVAGMPQVRQDEPRRSGVLRRLRHAAPRSPVADSVRARATAGSGEVFVGRGAPTRRAEPPLELARSSAKAGSALLAGEPGIGKTRAAQTRGRTGG